ncbi:MAG TPA: S1 RNA-binding domain-containing protein [Mesotoga infera]|jgi:small subunit ribosomal protein S1|uniref:30S ribosomal protein S1 n=2 Tax=Bacteria TaxID=2 RepID=A0A7Z7LIG9_9BACT|nr:S1 RNA-binding domain-containing protein [Mesotoga infera]MBP8660268.1 S1 RNA-binding domain-containing protein [Mesotoga sp.]NLI06102.1 S1 RNA-binding domain-containing protein [Thermotogaceae bacterium]SSC14058.1 30S ribosomal protein S1 [Mesotoga infera]HNS67575.1 S1 RNA-binding domain-containing protein [Mesotoga infera]HOI34638.1 S1 RNA-binding domain-containing protein [Mesotoga infera]
MEEKLDRQDENLSMEEIFEQMDVSSARKGSRKEAEVFSIQPDGLMVIMEGKLDGFVPLDQLVNDLNEYSVGDKIEVMVIKTNEEEGRSTVSEKRVHARQALSRVEKAFREGTPIEGRVVSETNAGYNIRLLRTVPAFLPGSESGIRKGESAPEGNLKFKVLRFKRQRNGINVVVSLKAFQDEAIKDYFEKLEVDQVVEGTVESIKNFGAFVRLNDNVTALIPASEMSWDPGVRISDLLKIGSTVKAKIIGIDENEKKISLSLKQMSEDPWATLEDRYPVGSTAVGIVKNITPFGFFVSLEPGVEGLVHISEVFWGNIKKDLKSVVEVGDEVKVNIKEINVEKRTLSLSYREAMGDPWENIGQKYSEGDIVKAKTAKVLPTGVILELEEYVSGFVPVSEVSWNFVDRIEDVVREGDETEVKILSIDSVNRRMRLSIKQATADPWERVSRELSVGDYISGTVTRLTKSGAIVMVDSYGVEAFLPVSQVSIERVENIEDAVSIGNHDQYKIIRLVYDPDNDTRNMVVSIRQLIKDKEAAESEEVMKDLNGNGMTISSNLGEMIKNQLKEEGENL